MMMNNKLEHKVSECCGECGKEYPGELKTGLIHKGVCGECMVESRERLKNLTQKILLDNSGK